MHEDGILDSSQFSFAGPDPRARLRERKIDKKKRSHVVLSEELFKNAGIITRENILYSLIAHYGSDH